MSAEQNDERRLYERDSYEYLTLSKISKDYRVILASSIPG